MILVSCYIVVYRIYSCLSGPPLSQRSLNLSNLSKEELELIIAHAEVEISLENDRLDKLRIESKKPSSIDDSNNRKGLVDVKHQSILMWKSIARKCSQMLDSI